MADNSRTGSWPPFPKSLGGIPASQQEMVAAAHTDHSTAVRGTAARRKRRCRSFPLSVFLRACKRGPECGRGRRFTASAAPIGLRAYCVGIRRFVCSVLPIAQAILGTVGPRPVVRRAITTAFPPPVERPGVQVGQLGRHLRGDDDRQSHSGYLPTWLAAGTDLRRESTYVSAMLR